MSDAVAATNDLPIDLTLSDDELDAHREHITQFIRRVVDDAGADGAVIGLSGGIDSTLTAHLAVEALGEGAVRGLVLPSEVNTEGNMSDAERVAELLDIEYDVVDIEPIVDAFFEAAPLENVDDRIGSDPLRTAAGNVRVRTRGVLNYFVANAESRIVLGTGNRSETLTGYFTKYGDQAVDCNPIGNLYKRQVRQLADYVGVPQDLVEKPPSAEMWAGQTDEEEMGLSYDLLDAILVLHVDGPLSASATASTLDVDDSVVARVDELYAQSEHKRHLPPAPDALSL
ncbi:NAD+ synthase [Halomarina salina]|uniref:NH(3)-dependent NAD(+) synthetase n=1 Tax=Halomarina salina TaxID=1872699 RepID=A0ABD5RN87_9EURY|nr:NAD+ synthase [Halomarina salina]